MTGTRFVMRPSALAAQADAHRAGAGETGPAQVGAQRIDDGGAPAAPLPTTPGAGDGGTGLDTDSADAQDLGAAFAAIRAELEVPGDFPADVVAEAEESASHPPVPATDATDVGFVTIDPPGSMDLDQALHLEREGEGYRVRYAIAAVPDFVPAGGALDAETRRRGETIYLPDGRAPLHPPVLSEGAASLLPDQNRPAYVWDLRLDSRGEVTAASVAPAMVRSRARLDYEGAQRSIDDGSADPSLLVLKEVGELRIALEHERGGASLPKPEQEIELVDGRYRLIFRPMLPVEDWNAQISLMTGMAAAQLMLDGGVGILRTMPAPDQASIATFRRQAQALGITWPEDMRYGDFLRTLDRSDPKHLALMHAATRLFRGAGYTPFDGHLPEQREHAAVAAPYAHVTAPLRRLVDRFGLAICVALSAGTPVPQWVRVALPELPDLMAASGHRSSAVERACADAVEAAVLSGDVGQTFPATVVDTKGDKGVVVQIGEPAIEALADGTAPLGGEVTVRVEGVDIAARKVHLVIV